MRRIDLDWLRIGAFALLILYHVGMFVIVPPQSYYELREAAAHADWWSFYFKYVTGYSGWCDADGCLAVPTWNHLWFVAYVLVYTLALAALTLALLGFARRHWNRDSPLRRYLTEAIFPFYILHQTAIVVIAYHLDKSALPLALEVTLVIAGTAAVCWGGFEVVRRTGVLRPMFGLKGSFRRQANAAR